MPSPDEVRVIVAETLAQVKTDSLLWSIREAQERSGMPRDRLIEAFHAGSIAGLWSAGRGRGSILLKPESVRAWIDEQVKEQSFAAPSRA